MRKYGESKTTRIMMATVSHVTSGLGLRKFQANGFLLTRVYQRILTFLTPFPLSLHIRNPLVCSQGSYVTRAQQNVGLMSILCLYHYYIHCATSRTVP